MAKNDFQSELEIYRTEEELAQQFFFAYLSVRISAENTDVLKMMNINPLFWATAHHAMLLSTFVAIGGIFGQSKHNVSSLMAAVSADLKEFSIAAQEARHVSRGLSTEEAAKYARHAHGLTDDDVGSLQKEVDSWQSIYKDRYRDIRDKVFAHKVFDLADGNKLLAKADVAEMIKLFTFLSALHLALFAAFHNGVVPDLSAYDLQMSSGEKVHQEGRAVLKSMLDTASWLVRLKDLAGPSETRKREGRDRAGRSSLPASLLMCSLWYRGGRVAQLLID